MTERARQQSSCRSGVTGDVSCLYNGLWPEDAALMRPLFQRPSNSDARHLFMKLNLEPPAESKRQMLLGWWWGGVDDRREVQI